jgi:hypothetical protein
VEVVLGGVVAALVAAGVTVLTQRWELRHRAGLLQRELEHQTRDALRQTYARLLVTQRKAREVSVRLAEAGGEKASPELAVAAVAAHAEFINAYHQLNLDSTRSMWCDARGLRDVLDDMLDLARRGQAAECRAAVKLARHARQNLERSFRMRLGYAPHQERQPLGKYDKSQEPGCRDEATDGVGPPGP